MTCAFAHVNFFLCDFATGNAIRQAGGRKTPTCCCPLLSSKIGVSKWQVKGK